MMWSVGILLATALSVESYTVHDIHERLSHGRQLKIFLPKSAEKLEFTPADDPSKTYLYWEKSRIRLIKGRVSGSGSDRRWYIDKVTYEDQGTYTQKDYWNKEISAVKVAVTTRHNFNKCVAGDSLSVQLEGLDLSDATLFFSGEAGNFTLVHHGARMSQDLPNYWDRVQTQSMKIEIRNVNYSDAGHYTLTDRRDRVVSVTRMDLTDHHENSDGNPFLALLLLLGIPAGICCCCRKKIFKKKAAAGATFQSSPDIVHPPPSGPYGPAPPFNAPGAGPSFHPPPETGGPGQWTGPQPSPGYNPSYPPQNPVYTPQNPGYTPQNPGYAPQNPAYTPQDPGYAPHNPAYTPQNPGYAPQNPAYTPQDPGYAPHNPAYTPQNPAYPPGGPAAQPPQWNGPPAGYYPAGPAAPMAEAASPPGPPPSTNILNASNDAYEFKIDGGNTTNFL
ncbi:DNA-directed RNA polymerase II subunit RPB1 [Liparis tanakae]|uniref:DNA-directed RNA polymerase II subunit RPB1 n=1 Tax=Liparis tanakae TaxID=230148 RepID=A0A4Z2HCY7_9TELE|nr:DNA-directed RNA polymerase II subunit RPB1 [Liparis tanakae]